MDLIELLSESDTNNSVEDKAKPLGCAQFAFEMLEFKCASDPVPLKTWPILEVVFNFQI